MKITSLRTDLVNVPLARPAVTAIHNIESVGCVLLTLETDADIQGESYVFTLNAARLQALAEMIRGVSPHLLGQDPHYVGSIREAVRREINPAGGDNGAAVYALSAIDTACWDLVGKSAGKPLHHLFGACRDRIKTYASGGLWLSQSIDELADEACRFKAGGFKAMKMRIGSDRVETDIQRVSAVREALGPEIELMVDANQAFTAGQAMQLGRRLQAFDLAWLEEPVASSDLEAQAQVTAALEMPIASGESEYTRFGMQRMIQHRACNILMPDLQRIGGLTEMLDTAALADAVHMPISTHVFTEHSLCIAGAAANCISVEHMPWLAPLFNETLVVEDGDLIIPQRPGTGFTFNREAVEGFRVEEIG